MEARLTHRGKIVIGMAAGLLAVGAGAATAAFMDARDASIDASVAAAAPEAQVGDQAPGAPGTEPSTAAVAATGASGPSGTSGASGASGHPAATAGQPATAGHPKGTGKWRVPVAKQALSGEIAGYAEPFVLPGEPIGIRVSTPAKKFKVVAYRIGDYAGRGATEVGHWGPFHGRLGDPAAPDPTTGAITAHWKIATELDTTDWQPGLYLIGLWTTGRHAKRATVPVIVASPEARDKVLLVAGDTTWQAYNTWGGRSAYKGGDGTFESRSRAVSFSRPYNWSGYRWPNAYDIPLIRWAESLDVPLAYGSVTSITANPESVDGALGIVSNGHDEYWPSRYRKALVEARDEGSNLAFLGANAGYWQTQMRDGGWTAWMPKEGSKLRWRDDPEAVAENAITGQLYDCYPSRADMVIRDPRFFLFRGTHVKRGSRLDNLVGNESDRVFPLESTPRPIQVPALTQVSCNANRTWSTMSYYTTSSGAGVFSTGTMDWVRAMGGPRSTAGLGRDSLRFTRIVTANLLRSMAKGPMGKTHPATDELDEVDLPDYSTSGAT